MKNIVAYLCSVTAMVALGFGFSSCKDDDPPSRPKLSFAETSMTVDEDDGNIEIELVLDKPHSKDLRIEYELGGTASDQDVVGTANADYEVVGDHGVVKIAAGETTGIIELNIYADAGFEEDETIEIAIIDTNTDEIELTENDEIVITISNDDEQLTASFPVTSLTVNESDGNAEGYLQIMVQLDKAPTQNALIKYTLGGDAVDSVKAWNEDDFGDYYIHGTSGELTIPAGQTSAPIEIQLYTDFLFEDEETIEITLVASNDVKVGTNSKMTIKLQQQDGKLIVLVWDKPEYTDVDMDLMLWAGEDLEDAELLTLSINAGTTPKLEAVFIPYEITGGNFGLSHNYYQGSADPLEFQVHFADVVDDVIEPLDDREVFTATYTAVNKFPWDQLQQWPAIVQTFKIVDGEYTDISEITVPSSGSRMRNMPPWNNKHKRTRKQLVIPF